MIGPDHVISALQALGFQEYIGEVKEVQQKYKEQALVWSVGEMDGEVWRWWITPRFFWLPLQKHRNRGKSRLDRLGVPEEELLRQQQELFEQARQKQAEVEHFTHSPLQPNLTSLSLFLSRSLSLHPHPLSLLERMSSWNSSKL